MPLCAYVDGDFTVAPDYSDVEWYALKKGKPDVTMLCCGEKGHVITRRGTQFFRHNRRLSTCQYASETLEHLECKKIIYLKARELGLEARPEAKLNGARADVLVTVEGKKLAFEVQLSRQSLERTREREEEIRHSDAHPIWLMRPVDADACRSEVHSFAIEITTGEMPVVELRSGESISLEKFVELATQAGFIEADMARRMEALEAKLHPKKRMHPWLKWALWGAGALIALKIVGSLGDENEER